jgi:hypothetical protein
VRWEGEKCDGEMERADESEQTGRSRGSERRDSLSEHEPDRWRRSSSRHIPLQIPF